VPDLATPDLAAPGPVAPPFVRSRDARATGCDNGHMADQPPSSAPANAAPTNAALANAARADAPATIRERTEVVRLRRAPKVIVFLVLGAAVGVFVAMILTFAFGDGVDTSVVTGVTYTQGQVFGFLALICGIVGIALGGAVAIVLDRRSRRQARDVTVDRTTVTLED
jgi:hypothetical protein